MDSLPVELIVKIHDNIAPGSISSLSFGLTCSRMRLARGYRGKPPPTNAECLDLQVESVCKWAVNECGLPLTPRVMEVISLMPNNIKLMRWLRARGCPWDARTCESAAIAIKKQRAKLHRKLNGLQSKQWPDHRSLCILNGFSLTIVAYSVYSVCSMS